KLKKKRAALRTSVTKSLKDLESQLSEIDPKIHDLEENLEILKNNFESLKSVDTELEPLFKVEEFDAEFQKSEEYRQKVVKCSFRTSKRIDELKRKSTETVVNNQFSTDSQSEPKHNESVRIKLPKLTLTKFYGDINNWLTFWNSFESAIHKNDSLDKIDKFNYLKAHLGGSALNTVEGLPITAANYDSAIDLLKERFAKTDVLIYTHINNILNTKPLKISNDVRAL
ncbi:uncharacterized protein LOC118191517, partial [Stegodyphus dumicola]|uniref:uncharacterized protein LOC118191517 n=1 Tax=Stegodyphus dumicola TaxID=202533 RepID=UPI0015A83C5E